MNLKDIIGTWYIIFMSLSTLDTCKQVLFTMNDDFKGHHCMNIHFSGIDGHLMTDYSLDYLGCSSDGNVDVTALTLHTNRTMTLVDLFDQDRMIIKIENQIIVLTRNVSAVLYPVSHANCA